MGRSSRFLALGASLMLALSFALLNGCSGDDPSGPAGDDGTRVIAPLEGAITDVPLVADQPTEVVFTLQLPPEVASVSRASVDVEATLDHVRIDGIPLIQLIARKAARLFGLADEFGAMTYFRVGGDAETVCEQGLLYGPFVVSHDTALNVDPSTAEADAEVLQIVNSGPFTICMIITPNFDGTLNVDGIAMDLEEGDCEAPADFAGVWTGTYQCGDSCGESFAGSVEVTVTQNGAQASYVDGGGDHYTGRVCGQVFRFERIDENEIERGTLTLTGPNTAEKRSTWRSQFPPYCWGDCIDELTREPVVAGGP